jgi:hypothetical protein
MASRIYSCIDGASGWYSRWVGTIYAKIIREIVEIIKEVTVIQTGLAHIIDEIKGTARTLSVQDSALPHPYDQ